MERDSTQRNPRPIICCTITNRLMKTERSSRCKRDKVEPVFSGQIQGAPASKVESCVLRHQKRGEIALIQSPIEAETTKGNCENTVEEGEGCKIHAQCGRNVVTN